MLETNPSTLLLLGRDHQRFGEVELRCSQSGRLACAISVGAQPQAPASRSKLFEDDLNEDGLLAIEQDSRSFLAIADAHYGSQASAHLLQELARIVKTIPVDPDGLMDCLTRIRPGDENRLSATTLLVAVHDASDGEGFGICFGDSTLSAVGPGGFRRLSAPNGIYLAPADHVAMPIAKGSAFSFRTQPDELLLAYSDGINECHYRQPETSIQPDHLSQLHRRLGTNPRDYAEALAEWALRGVDGHPGGEDNLALIVSSAEVV